MGPHGEVNEIVRDDFLQVRRAAAMAMNVSSGNVRQRKPAQHRENAAKGRERTTLLLWADLSSTSVWIPPFSQAMFCISDLSPAQQQPPVDDDDYHHATPSSRWRVLRAPHIRARHHHHHHHHRHHHHPTTACVAIVLSGTNKERTRAEGVRKDPGVVAVRQVAVLLVVYAAVPGPDDGEHVQSSGAEVRSAVRQEEDDLGPAAAAVSQKEAAAFSRARMLQCVSTVPLKYGDCTRRGRGQRIVGRKGRRLGPFGSRRSRSHPAHRMPW